VIAIEGLSQTTSVCKALVILDATLCILLCSMLLLRTLTQWKVLVVQRITEIAVSAAAIF
jgi:hypothetical protein